MIREDRDLLTELARLNRELAPLALRMMDGSASTIEQPIYAGRLIAAGERLQRRATEAAGVVIDGEVLTNQRLAFPPHTVESLRES
ncbi:MAG: hypothetical protein ACRDQU_22770 [Pseudonocardiaceae bacterium]